jgi:hypothetical protein
MARVLRRFWARAARGRLGADDADWLQGMGRRLARDRLRDRETSAALASTLLETWNRGWPLASIDEQSRTLMSISPDEVDEALRACSRNLVLAITGDQDVIRAALAPPKPPSAAP